MIALFGADWVKYDKLWRTGANEATTMEISADVKLEGQILKAGKYSFFTIPGKEKMDLGFQYKTRHVGDWRIR